MSLRTEAEEHLRIIRSLMEKATVYRAISAPGALIGGGAALLVGGLASSSATPERTPLFAPVWFGVLAFTTAINFWLLRRDALRRQEPFISPGMRLALRAMLPGLLGGGLCFFLQKTIGPALLAALWALFYGVSLLAASHFAPKSICWLGRAFFVAGAGLIVVSAWTGDDWLAIDPLRTAHGIMAGTFGFLHLVYAACTWPRRAAARLPVVIA